MLLHFLSGFSKLLQSCVSLSPELIPQLDFLKQLLSTLVAVLTLNTEGLGVALIIILNCIAISVYADFILASKVSNSSFQPFIWHNLPCLNPRCRHAGHCPHMLGGCVYAHGYSGEERQFHCVPICFCHTGEKLADVHRYSYGCMCSKSTNGKSCNGNQKCKKKKPNSMVTKWSFLAFWMKRKHIFKLVHVTIIAKHEHSNPNEVKMTLSSYIKWSQTKLKLKSSSDRKTLCVILDKRCRSAVVASNNPLSV